MQTLAHESNCLLGQINTGRMRCMVTPVLKIGSRSYSNLEDQFTPCTREICKRGDVRLKFVAGRGEVIKIASSVRFVTVACSTRLIFPVGLNTELTCIF